MFTFKISICFIILGITALVLTADNHESFCETLDKELGVCINIKTQIKACTPLYEMLKNREWGSLRKNICDNNSTRVCCPLTDFNEVIKSPTELNYKDHPNFKLLPQLSACGLSYSLSDRIIGGKATKPGEFPWMVRLGFQSKDGGSISYSCSGTLISNRYVMTAAHCFKNPTHELVEVILAENDEDVDEECIKSDTLDGGTINVACSKAIEAQPETVTIHPGYNYKVGSGNDIALIRLKQDINTDSYFTRPICLPLVNEYHVSTKLDEGKLIRQNLTIVAGWGRTNNEEAVGSNILQYVRVPIQPQIFCRVSYGSYNVTNDQICAGGVKGEDSCLGDSGGPLFLATNPEKQSRSLRAFQIGIVSYGRTTCAKGGEPVVYTRVRSFITWILDNIK